ncbi:hypothetical protein KUCAC02_034284, partial [Chaenocephalus aceratus]
KSGGFDVQKRRFNYQLLPFLHCHTRATATVEFNTRLKAICDRFKGASTGSEFSVLVGGK